MQQAVQMERVQVADDFLMEGDFIAWRPIIVKRNERLYQYLSESYGHGPFEIKKVLSYRGESYFNIATNRGNVTLNKGFFKAFKSVVDY